MSSTLKFNLDHQLLAQIVDVWYANMRDDYRINRYFYDRPLADQAERLKQLLSA